eukprot:6413708-Amphidinium_carterae.1
MPKRPLPTNVEDELPTWAKSGSTQPPAAAAAAPPVLVTKPVTKVEKKPMEWVDQPEPQIWQ